MNKKSLLYVIISAVLFGISSPLAKLILADISPVALAGLLYSGAFLGLIIFVLGRRIFSGKAAGNSRLEKKDMGWLAGAIVTGGIAAPVAQMTGLNLISGYSASLLLNLEGVFTAVIAIFVFRENSGKRLWLALILMTAAGVLISWNPQQGKFNVAGPLLLVLSTLCWGIDNNLTRHISGKDPVQITWIKGLSAGVVSLSLAFIFSGGISLNVTVLYALLLGAFSYGISLIFFIMALRGLGASRTGAFFSMGPLVGAIISLLIFRNAVTWIMLPAGLLMAFGVWLIYGERHVHPHVHPAVTHSHIHNHEDLHHFHEHGGKARGAHFHEHAHPELVHAHVHWPDTEHRHGHA